MTPPTEAPRTAPRINWEINMSLVISTVLWLGSAIWFASTLTASVRELERDRADQSTQLYQLRREGSELARQDHVRIITLERRAEVNDATLARISDLLSRIDENVKALKEQQAKRPQ